MTAADDEARHPSDIDGVTDEYWTFLKTWGKSCGAPLAVFQGNLNLVVQAELRAVGQDVVQYTRNVLQKQQRNRRALDGLTTDLIAFLETHDCVTQGHVGEGCPDGAALIERLRRAREVLALDRP